MMIGSKQYNQEKVGPESRVWPSVNADPEGQGNWKEVIKAVVSQAESSS